MSRTFFTLLLYCFYPPDMINFQHASEDRGGIRLATSEARKRASEKWQHDKIDDIRMRVPKGMREQIQAHAESMGETMNAFLNRAVAETMERDKR